MIKIIAVIFTLIILLNVIAYGFALHAIRQTQDDDNG